MNLPIDRVCIVDFEASCLPAPGVRSYPIEVAIGWVPDASQPHAHRVRDWVIKPEREWEKWRWDPAAETVHGLSREYLREKGEPLGRVAQQLLVTIEDRLLLSDAPEFEFRWLDTLLGYPAAAKLDLEIYAVELEERARMLEGQIFSPSTSAARQFKPGH